MAGNLRQRQTEHAGLTPEAPAEGKLRRSGRPGAGQTRLRAVPVRRSQICALVRSATPGYLIAADQSRTDPSEDVAEAVERTAGSMPQLWRECSRGRASSSIH